MPIQKTKFTIAQPHATGWFNPHTPTPVVNRYPIITKHIIMVRKLTPKATFHHRGILSSTMLDTLSVIQPNGWLLSTYVGRASSSGV